MRRRRTKVPEAVGGEILFAAAHTCCVCRESGKPLQLHHIDGDPSNHDVENLAPLCLICHDQTQIEGGFGRKLRSEEVKRYRDDWLERVRTRRDKADELAALRTSGTGKGRIPTTAEDAVAVSIPEESALRKYIEEIPGIVRRAVAEARPKWDSGVTAEMMQGWYGLLDVLHQIWVHLATWYPPDHFSTSDPSEYFGEYIKSRFQWHRAINEPEGAGTGGTIVGPLSAGAVTSDVEKAIRDTVTALLWRYDDSAIEGWVERWDKARKPA